MTDPPVYYWGRLWDAPFTDDAKPMARLVIGRCELCNEKFEPTDDIVMLRHVTSHLECHLRMALGDVAHLEGRCLCSRGRGNEIVHAGDVYESWRDSAKAALQWLVDHGRGRFR